MKSLFAEVQNILIERSPGSAQELTRAHVSVSAGHNLVDALIENGFSAQWVGAALAQVYQLPFKPYVDSNSVDRRLLARISSDYVRNNRMLPLRFDRGDLVVAVADPSHYCPLDDLGILFQTPVRPVVVPVDVLGHALSRVYEGDRLSAEGPIIKLEEERLDAIARQLSQERIDLLDWDSTPIVRLVNALMWEVIAERARTVHFEPCERELRVCYQSELRWYDIASAPKCLAELIASCLKVMAGLSSEKVQAPQKGRIRLRVGRRALEVRASVVPDRFGEWISLDFDEFVTHRDELENHAVSQQAQLISSNQVILLKSPLCGRCGEEVVVKDALFCKCCGFRLPALRRADQIALPSGPASYRRSTK
jgi:hypothetical protein